MAEFNWDNLLTEFDVKEATRINEALAPPIDALVYLRSRARRSTLERISEAVDNPFMLGAWCGFIAGCFTTVLSAIIWGTML